MDDNRYECCHMEEICKLPEHLPYKRNLMRNTGSPRAFKKCMGECKNSIPAE